MCLFLYQPLRWTPKSGTPKTSLLLNTPIIIQLQDPTKYITQAQYPLSLQSLRELKPIIYDLLRKKLLCPTSSPFNTCC